MRTILDDVLLHGQNSASLEAAHSLLRTLTSDKKYARAMSSGGSMTKILEKNGFGGLWRSCSMGAMDDIHRDCFDLTEKLIEVSLDGHCTRQTLTRWQLIII
jgi:neurofibromin 1